MTKKIVTLFVLIFVCAAFALGISACTNDNPSAHEHTYDRQVASENYLAKEATCTGKATYYYSCSCGEKGTETFEYGEALGHSFTNYVSDNNATCTKDGTKTAKCDRCDETYTVTDTGSKLVHTFDKEVATEKYLCSAAICTQKATYYYSCSCGEKGTETFEYGNLASHPAETEWSYNETHHWRNSTCACNVKVDYEEHKMDDSGRCTVCQQNVLPTEGVIYDVSADSTYAEVIGYIGTSTKVKISETYNNLPVRSIYKEAFKDTKIDTVVIPDGVTSIGESAFSGCSSLTSVTIPDGVTSIGESAFYNCYSLTRITIPFVGATKDGTKNTHFGYIFGAESGLYNSYYVPSSLKTVVITGGETIGSSAFRGCERLGTITIPDSVTSIGESAFYECTSLTTITIPDSATSVGSSAFYQCRLLTSVIIGNGVTSIGDQAFNGCGNLQYNVYSNAKYLGNANNPYHALITPLNNKLSSYEIHNKTKVICYNAFTGCERIGTIIIPDSVTSIGDYAFEYCSSLTSVTIPNSVTSIGQGAFSNCSSLTAITIPNSVTLIGRYAFKDCSSLTSITIPFVGATKDGTGNTRFGYIFGDDRYSYKSYYVPSSLKTVIITGGETIGDYAFSGCSSLTSVTIPDGVTSIGDYAFEYCSSLTSVTIPNSVTSIGQGAFSNCSSLTTVTIPNGVTYIGRSAFYNCYSLTRITIPFVGATKDGTKNTHFGYIFGADSYWENSSYVPSSLKTVVITGGETIGASAFYGCSSLTAITIPNGVTYIGRSAFYNCSSLTAITIPDSVTSIGDYAFEYCSSLTAITIPDGVTSIGDSAFYGCSSLTAITIPDSVTSIGDYAFKYCSSLTAITIPNSVTLIGRYAFYNCSSLTTITIPFVGATKDGTKNPFFGYIFGADSYWGNSSYVPSSLKTVVITGGETIGYAAFYNCSSLTAITIPDSVTSIGDYAFEYCSSLTAITIPDSVTSIGESAFYNCSSLTSITYEGTIAQWNEISKGYQWKSNVPASCVVHCTDGDINI